MSDVPDATDTNPAAERPGAPVVGATATATAATGAATAARAPTAADLDDAALRTLVELDPDGSKGVLDRLRESFVNEAADRVAELRSALAERDAETIRRSAHRLKGSSLYFGARLVSDIARDLEELGRDGDIDRTGPMIDELGREVDRLRVDLPVAIARLRQEWSGPR